MNAMMTLRCNNRRKKIFIWYDFRQIRDAVLLMFFSDKTDHFEKIFIYANAGRWETDVLRYYIDDDAYGPVCKKLQYLFEYRESPTDFETIAIEKAVENYAKVLVGQEV